MRDVVRWTRWTPKLPPLAADAVDKNHTRLLVKCVAADVEGLHIDMTAQAYVSTCYLLQNCVHICSRAIPYWPRAEDASSHEGHVCHQEPISMQSVDAGVAPNHSATSLQKITKIG